MGYNKRYMRLHEDTIADLAGNRCLDEILDLHDLLIQSIRKYLSRHLYYTDYDKPLECNMRFSYFDGNHQKKMVTITRMWQDPIEGRIIFDISDRTIDWEDLSLEDKIYILECFENGY